MPLTAITGHLTCGSWMASHRLGSYKGLGQLVTSVPAAAHRNIVTQCLGISGAQAEQVAQGSKTTAILLLFCSKKCQNDCDPFSNLHF